jgi:hypothetical protein
VFIEVFRALASRQRMFGEMQLAEGEEPESNILQVLLRNQVELARNLADKFVLQEPKSDSALLNKEMWT